jgi:hypothetical protein
MEPVFMILGQSAATAACMSIDRDIAVQDLDYESLRDRLLADGQVLELEDVYETASKSLPGTVLDDRYARLQGGWSSSSANPRFVDAGYQHNANDPSAIKSAEFKVPLVTGDYEVRLSYPPNQNRATNVPVDIQHADGATRVHVNQRAIPPIDGLFVSLGTFRFVDAASVIVRTEGTDGYVILDAVQFLPVKQ